MKTSSEYKKAIEIVRAKIAAWDPYDLLAGGAPSDEFDGEVSQVVAKLRAVSSPGDLAVAISGVFRSQFSDDSFTPESCAEVALAIFTELQESGVLMPNNSRQARRP